MTEGALLHHLLDRLGDSPEAEVVFGWDEVADWPPGTLEALHEAGVIHPGPPAQVLECWGCEENCVQPVEVIPAEGDRPARAFIACDRRDDVGPVSVDFPRLNQWRLGGASLAEVLGKLLGLERVPREENGRNAWGLGTLKGKSHQASVFLVIQSGVSLELAGHVVLLADVLTLHCGELVLDKAYLRRLSGRPIVSPEPIRPQAPVSKAEKRAIETRQKYAAWGQAYRALKRDFPGETDGWYARKIAKMPIGKGFDPETIRRRMKNPK